MSHVDHGWRHSSLVDGGTDPAYFTYESVGTGGGGGGGIQFDTTPQIGTYLDIETTGPWPGGGSEMKLTSDGVMALTSNTLDISLYAGRYANIYGTSSVAIDSPGGIGIGGETAVTITSNSGQIELSGQSLELNGDNIDIETGAGILRMYASGGDIKAYIETGFKFTIFDNNADPIFEVREDGSVHGITGGSITWDL